MKQVINEIAGLLVDTHSLVQTMEATKAECPSHNEIYYQAKYIRTRCGDLITEIERISHEKDA